jgi:hypothetical protein
LKPVAQKKCFGLIFPAVVSGYTRFVLTSTAAKGQRSATSQPRVKPWVNGRNLARPFGAGDSNGAGNPDLVSQSNSTGEVVALKALAVLKTSIASSAHCLPFYARFGK